MNKYLDKEIISRVLEAFELKKKKDLADLFNIKAQDLSNRIRKGTLIKLIETEAYKRKVNFNWILTGEGSPFPASDPRDPPAIDQKNESAELALKAIVGLMDENRELKDRIGKLEEKCSKFEKIIESLQKENTELRREVNRFKATYESGNPDGGDGSLTTESKVS
jgi:DNA-binding Lrp family transcriptional regulator